MEHQKKVLDYFSKWAGKGTNPENDMAVTRDGDILFLWADRRAVMEFPGHSSFIIYGLAARLLKLDGVDERGLDPVKSIAKRILEGDLWEVGVMSISVRSCSAVYLEGGFCGEAKIMSGDKPMFYHVTQEVGDRKEALALAAEAAAVNLWRLREAIYPTL